MTNSEARKRREEAEQEQQRITDPVTTGGLLEKEFDEYCLWLHYGKTMGWVSEEFCATHDGTPLTEAELTEFDEGGDPCIYAVRTQYWMYEGR